MTTSSSLFGSSLELATFQSFGKTVLASIFIADGRGPHPTLLLLHGFPGTDRNFDLAHAIRRAGWNVMIFHYRGAWGSEGAFSFGGALCDVSSAIQFLRSASAASAYRIDASRIAIAGHSMGGFIALMTAAGDAAVLGAASWGGFNFGEFAKTLTGDPEKMSGVAEVWETQLAPLRGAIAQNLVNEVLRAGEAWNLRHIGSALRGRSILLIGAEADSVAPPSLHHVPLVNAFNDAGVSLVSKMLDAEHGFTVARYELTHELLAWLEAL